MKVQNLSYSEQEALSTFLLDHMQQEARGKLMVQQPVVYRKLLGMPADEAFLAQLKAVVLGGFHDRPVVEVREVREEIPQDVLPDIDKIHPPGDLDLAREARHLDLAQGLYDLGRVAGWAAPDKANCAEVNATTALQLSGLFVEACAALGKPLPVRDATPEAYAAAGSSPYP